MPSLNFRESGPNCKTIVNRVISAVESFQNVDTPVELQSLSPLIVEASFQEFLQHFECNSAVLDEKSWDGKPLKVQTESNWISPWSTFTYNSNGGESLEECMTCQNSFSLCLSVCELVWLVKTLSLCLSVCELERHAKSLLKMSLSFCLYAFKVVHVYCNIRMY